MLSRPRLTAMAALLLAAAPLTAAPLAAQAATASVTFTGSGTSGTDPLSGEWTAGPNDFGFSTFLEPPLDTGDMQVFQGGDGLADATSFTFTYTGTIKNAFNLDLGSGLTHVETPEGVQWITTYLSPTEVEFTAPAGDELKPGDTFDIQVAFKKAITAGNFSFTATWGGDAAAVPEPASWALMILGIGGAGACLRRRRRPRSEAA
jgi:hypothetical protein